MTSCTLLLIRHGETVWNREGRIQGALDSSLSPGGITQARSLAARLAAERPDALVSSDLGRARATAGEIERTTGLAAAFDPELRERSYGVLEGKTWSEIEREHPHEFARLSARDPDFVVPEGESAAQFRGRVLGALRRAARRHAGQCVAIVAHGGVLGIAWREAMAVPLDAPRDYALPNASVNRFRHDGERLVLEQWGDVAHLGAGAADDGVDRRHHA